MKDKLTNEDVSELLEVLLVHWKLVNKVPPEKLGWGKKALFNKHKNKVNTLYERLDEK